MPEGWLPKTELLAIFRHVVVAVATALAVWILSQAVILFVPDVRDLADLIDQVVFLVILVITGVKLTIEVVRGDGFHAFAVA